MVVKRVPPYFRVVLDEALEFGNYRNNKSDLH